MARRPSGPAAARVLSMLRATRPRMVVFAWAFVAAVGAAACTPTARVHSASLPTAPFADYRSFSFGASEGAPERYQGSARSAEVQRRVRGFVATALQQKGYRLVDGRKGDFVVAIAAGQRDREVHLASHAHPGWINEDEEVDFVEGAFVIDVFDGTNDGQVWHGSARVAINPEKIEDALLQRSVSQVVASFPARHAVAGAGLPGAR